MSNSGASSSPSWGQVQRRYERTLNVRNGSVTSSTNKQVYSGFPQEVVCTLCGIAKGDRGYSENQKALFKSGRYDIVCLSCTDAPKLELECYMCLKTLPVTKFAKSQLKEDEPECIACVRERICPVEEEYETPLERAAILKLDDGKGKVQQLGRAGWKAARGKETAMSKTSRSVQVDVSRDEALSEVMDNLALDVVGDYEVGESDSEGIVEDSDDDDSGSDFSM